MYHRACARPVVLEQREEDLVVARRQAPVGFRLDAARAVLAWVDRQDPTQQAFAAEAQRLGELLGDRVAGVGLELEALEGERIEGPADREARRRGGDTAAARLTPDPVAELAGRDRLEARR